MSGSFTTNDGASVSRSRTTNLKMTYSSVVNLMRISEDVNFVGVEWKPASQTATYTFNSVGKKKLYVSFSNINALQVSYSQEIEIILFDPSELSFDISNPEVNAPTLPVFNLINISKPLNAKKIMVSINSDFSDANWTDLASTASVSAPYNSSSCKSHNIYLKFKDKDDFESVTIYKTAQMICSQVVSVNGAPSPRAYASQVWTGSEIIIFGGFIPNGDQSIPAFSNGAKYDPKSNSWTSISVSPSNRVQHSAVWDGTKMIVWGGRNSIRWDTTSGSSLLTDLLFYVPSVDQWEAANPSGAPSARNYESAVWTGNEMIIWGGGSFTQYHSGGCLNDGKKYNPNNNTWSNVNNSGAPSERCGHVAAWTGSEMIIWGGYSSGNPGHLLYDGAYYNPVNDSWRAMPSSTITIPSQAINGSDVEPAGIWNGQKLIVWTGNGGLSFNPNTNIWASIDPIPGVRTSRGAASWIDNNIFFWGTQQWDISGPGARVGFKFYPDPFNN